MAPREGSVEGRNESGARKKSQEEREKKKNTRRTKGGRCKRARRQKASQTNPHAALFLILCFFFFGRLFDIHSVVPLPRVSVIVPHLYRIILHLCEVFFFLKGGVSLGSFAILFVVVFSWFVWSWSFFFCHFGSLCSHFRLIMAVLAPRSVCTASASGPYGAAPYRKAGMKRLDPWSFTNSCTAESVSG